MDDTDTRTADTVGPWGPQAPITLTDLAREYTDEDLGRTAAVIGQHRRALAAAEFDHEAACRDLEDADATRARAARRVEHTAHALRIVRDQYSALAALVVR